MDSQLSNETELNEDEALANFIESEVLSVTDVESCDNSRQICDTSVKPNSKKVSSSSKVENSEDVKVEKSSDKCLRNEDIRDANQNIKDSEENAADCSKHAVSLKRKREVESFESLYENTSQKYEIENGPFSKLPIEIFHHIFKFLSSEDLVNCASVCRIMRVTASEESIWQRLYRMRWGLPQPQKGELRACTWKQLYIERDRVEMTAFIKDCPSEFKEYYIQMQTSKRSEVPCPSKFRDDFVVCDTTLDEQISKWKKSHGLPDIYTGDHVCSGRTCTYSQAGSVFLCEKTGLVHVCDHTCREAMLDTANQNFVCPISGRCTVQWLSTAEEEDAVMNLSFHCCLFSNLSY
eukprot:TRINITY_DN3480_c0_g1_i1.p1 TRINITY_DN3480_c0_g1~~TRINITY_DN3480_c0_g1_i1.p1  ORF type:complete len:386 (+),score=70.61 TRINITY_DN3480_c0_g1_i1:111-1160(+)